MWTLRLCRSWIENSSRIFPGKAVLQAQSVKNTRPVSAWVLCRGVPVGVSASGAWCLCTMFCGCLQVAMVESPFDCGCHSSTFTAGSRHVEVNGCHLMALAQADGAILLIIKLRSSFFDSLFFFMLGAVVGYLGLIHIMAMHLGQTFARSIAHC